MLRLYPLAAVSLVALGCSALVNPDESRLGGDDRDGSVGGRDGGPPITLVDGGAPRDDGAVPGRDGNVVGVDGGGVCVPGCDGMDVVTCSGGEPTRTRCPLGCDATGAAPRCLGMVPSNVPASLFDEDAEDITITGARRVLDTSVCAPEGLSAHVVPQTGGPELCVLVTGALRVEASTGLYVVGRRPLVILASDEVRIEGLVDVAAWDPLESTCRHASLSIL